MIDAVQLEELKAQPVPPELLVRFRLNRCPHCKRRPELVTTRGAELAVRTSEADPTVVLIPRYEVLPCCSAKYSRTVEHATRKQRIQAQAVENRRRSQDVSIKQWREHDHGI